MPNALMTCACSVFAALALAGCDDGDAPPDSGDTPANSGETPRPPVAGTGPDAPVNDAPATAAAVEGNATFRAIGQEPGWIMDLFEGDRIRLTYQYGTKEAVLPFPRTLGGPRPFEAQAQSGGDRLTLSVTEEDCTDPMNARAYGWTVSVTINETDLSGCGEWL